MKAIHVTKSICALCQRHRPLRLSHLTPAFVGRYLKETSATGYLRDAIEPNIRRQDLRKTPLLCGECELLFSAWERDFSLNAFPLVQSDSFSGLVYDDWLIKFAVSLSWRSLVKDANQLVVDYPQFKNVTEQFLDNWRLFLLGKRNNPGSEHHLFVFSGVPSSVSGDVHPKMLHYMLRGIDATPVVGRRQLAVFVKLMRSIFYSPLIPSSPKGWLGTKIHNGPASIRSPQKLAMRGFGEFLNSRVAEVFAKPLSQKQNDAISQAMLANPERAVSSESFKVWEASTRLFKT